MSVLLFILRKREQVQFTVVAIKFLGEREWAASSNANNVGEGITSVIPLKKSGFSEYIPLFS